MQVRRYFKARQDISPSCSASLVPAFAGFPAFVSGNVLHSSKARFPGAMVGPAGQKLLQAML
jgi:hypothetical protein